MLVEVTVLENIQI